ncbi:unnamed protein product [Brassica rapa subsp. trilocularis]
MVQKPHTVKDYLEEYMDTAKKCKPKPTSSGADAKLKRSSAENSRRPKTLGVELSLSLPCTVSLFSLCVISLLSPSSSLVPCGGGGGGCSRLVVVVRCRSSLVSLFKIDQISSPLSLVSRS